MDDSETILLAHFDNRISIRYNSLPIKRKECLMFSSNNCLFQKNKSHSTDDFNSLLNTIKTNTYTEEELDGIENTILLAMKSLELPYRVPKYLKMIILNDVMKAEEYQLHYNMLPPNDFCDAIEKILSSFFAKRNTVFTILLNLFRARDQVNPAIIDMMNIIEETKNQELEIPSHQGNLIVAAIVSIQAFVHNIMIYLETSNNIINYCRRYLKDPNNNQLLEDEPEFKKILQTISRNIVYDSNNINDAIDEKTTIEPRSYPRVNK